MYFFIIIIIIGLGLLLLISKGTKSGRAVLDSKAVYDQMKKVKAGQSSRNISEIKSAILAADKLVDYILKSRGYRGETLAERIKPLKNQLGDTYQKFWDAHKVRNRLVHEVESEVRFYEAQESVQKFIEVLYKLGVK